MVSLRVLELMFHAALINGQLVYGSVKALHNRQDVSITTTINGQNYICSPVPTTTPPPVITGQPSVITTSSVGSDGVIHTVVIISGGPITSPVTLPTPASTKLDPSGTVVKGSLEAISSHVSSAIPLAIGWADNPDPTRLSSAIEALQTVIPELGGLTQDLPGGDAILEHCELTGDSLEYKVNDVLCELIAILGGLQSGQGTIDPYILGPIIEGIRGDIDQAKTDLDSAIVIISGKPTTTSTTTTTTGSTTIIPPILLTTLPPGAIFVTLTDYTETTPVYITTTSPGGNEPTIVPIIIPIIGPPRICFGCYISFPPNIQIKVPEFCIQLFGLKIGNCPKDDSTPPSKTNDNPTTTPTTTTTTETCSTTITVTYESVFCTVTGSAASEIPCSTQVYSMVTGCSVTGSTTTTTTTIRSKPTEVLCAPDTCGGSACPLKRSIKPARQPEHSIIRRGDPEEGDWTDPSDYIDPKLFLAGEVFEAYNTEVLNTMNYVVKLSGMADREPQMTTSETIQFLDKPVGLAVQGLYGCTSVVVISERGAWASHIWEPWWGNPDQTEFSRRVSEFILTGLRPEDPQYKQHRFGLVNLRGNTVAENGIGTIFGNDGSDVPGTRVYVFAPRPRIYLQKKFDKDKNFVAFTDQNGNIIPESVYLASDANAAAGIEFQTRVNDVKGQIFRVLGQDTPFEIIQYSPMRYTVEQEKMDPAYERLSEILGDNNQEKPRGKLYIQYQPGKCGTRPEASWRLWVEDQLDLAGRTSSWVASGNQLWKGTSKQKRQDGGSCPIPTEVPTTTPPITTAAPVTTVDSSGHTIVIGPSGTTTLVEPSQTAGPRACNADNIATICVGPNFICHGGSVPGCEDGKCVCNPPKWAPGTFCNAVADCPAGSCSADQTVVCEAQTCVCKTPPPVTTQQPSTTTTVTPATTEAPKPTPTDAVYINFSFSIASSDGAIGAAGKWNMFEKKLDGQSLELCETNAKSYKLDFDTGLSSVPWPPSFSSDSDILGRIGCHYIENTNGAGRFACDGVNEFDCVIDPQSDKQLGCDFTGLSITYVPRVQCIFPA